MQKIAVRVLSISLAFSLMGHSAANAETQYYSILKEKKEVEESLSELSKRMDKLNTDFKNLEKQESEIESNLEENSLEIVHLNAKKETTIQTIREISDEIKKTEAGYKNILNNVDTRSNLLKQRLVTLQENTQTTNYLSILLGAQNFSDFLDRFGAILKVIEADQNLIAVTIVDQKVLSQKKNLLEKHYIQLADEKMNLDRQVTNLEQLQSKQKELLEEISINRSLLLQEKDTISRENSNLVKAQKDLSKTINNYTSSNTVSVPPAEYIPYYLASGERYNVDWYIIAAIHSVETGYSTHPTMISSAGAIGHTQFLPLTWVGYKYEDENGNVSKDIDITNLFVIKNGGGYGRDGDGDGIADPYNIADAIESTAYYLSSHGYTNNPAKAIWHYNHAQWYVDKVLIEAHYIKSAMKDI
jgi:peptidoglycan hydrolase CwlO-like protein